MLSLFLAKHIHTYIHTLFQIDLLSSLSEDDSNLMWKRQILFELGLSPRKVFHINACGFPFEVLVLLFLEIVWRVCMYVCMYACMYVSSYLRSTFALKYVYVQYVCMCDV
jgi:hypothetical protein